MSDRRIHQLLHLRPDEPWGKQFSLIAVQIQETDIQWVLHYYYAAATKEVEQFVKPDTISRIAIKKGDILTLPFIED